MGPLDAVGVSRANAANVAGNAFRNTPGLSQIAPDAAAAVDRAANRLQYGTGSTASILAELKTGLNQSLGFGPTGADKDLIDAEPDPAKKKLLRIQWEANVKAMFSQALSSIASLNLNVMRQIIANFK